MKNIIGILLMLIMIFSAFSLVGCDEAVEEPIDDVEEVDEEPVDVSDEYTADDPLVIRISFLNAPDDSSVMSGRRWAEMLEERSDGRIILEVFPAGELGGARENFQAMQDGSLEMASLIPGTIAGFDARLELNSLPGLFIETETAQQFDRDGFIGEAMQQYYEENGIIRLVGGEPNFYYFFTTDDAGTITNMAEMEGARLRIPESPMMLHFFEGANATPTPMPWGEIYSGLQRNVIDGTVGNLIWSIAAQFHEVATNISLVPVQYTPSDWLFSKAAWDNIPSDLQQIILDSIPDIQEYAEASWVEEEQNNIAMLEAQGVQIIEISEEAQIQWQQDSYEVWKDYVADVWGDDMLERIEEEILLR